MTTWTAVILTCPNKNSSLAYQKELEIRQQKGFIAKESLVISIEDPEEPIGSGGATLNALYTIAEALSAKKSYRMTQIEVIKNSYILIMHMGRSYPFDLIGKAFATLPFQDEDNYNLLTNFDLIYQTMTNQITGLNSNKPHSDPGVYICSTDSLCVIPRNEIIHIKDSSICVLSSKTTIEIAKLNGIYKLDESKNFVNNIYYMPDDVTLQKLTNKEDEAFNLVSNIVYFNYEVAQVLYSLMLYSPLDACSYIGIDSGASPLCLSLFFDILLACCKEIDKDEYFNGSFKSNHSCRSNSKSTLKSARITLWNSLHDKFQIKNITLSNNCKNVYMNNETFEHRKQIFDNHEQFLSIQSSCLKLKTTGQDLMLSSLIDSSTFNNNNNKSNNKTIIVNSFIKETNITTDSNLIINCQIDGSEIELGANTVISDINWKDKKITIGPDLIIQNAFIHLECLNLEVSLNIVFGLKDNFMIPLNNSEFKIFNENWQDFIAKTSINESDLWANDIDQSNRTLFNAKLYSLLHSGSCEIERNNLSDFFWIEMTKKTPGIVNKWRNSLRLSLEDIFPIINLEKVFNNRRFIFNCINTDLLINHIVENKVTQFIPLIKNSVHDGYVNNILKKLDDISLKFLNDLVILPRLMSFISITLSEMALDFSTLRSGPSQNVQWLDSFQLIEKGQIKQAILSLSKERENWLSRNDLVIRASRHYEGAMLGFIRQATSSFKHQFDFNLKKITNKTNFNWVEVNSPARLDLAGAWSDTPPITYECPGGSCVMNVAILVNGKKPIGARGRIINMSKSAYQQLSIKITMQESSNCDQDDESLPVSFEYFDLNDFKDYNKPQATCCLMKAVFVFTKLIDLEKEQTSLNEQLLEKLNGSLELVTWTGLPHGSGLGTSSILISCVLKIVWYLMGIEVSDETLSYGVLIVEQLMTTNGGWQDQIGGVYGGFKLTRTKNSLPLEISVKQINLNKDFIDLINDRLVLVYTGITRLAKDLLLNVLRNWYAISKKIFDNVNDLVINGQRCAEALETGDLVEFGNCINKHRMQKLVMAPGSEPESVQELIRLINEDSYGIALAGAGGGGFLYVLTKDSSCKKKIKDKIVSAKLNMQLYDAKISLDGIEFKFID